jgi:hypothetical protein
MYFSLLVLLTVLYANFVGRPFIFDPTYCLYPDSLNLYLYRGAWAAHLYAKDVFWDYALQARHQIPALSHSLLFPLFSFLSGHFNLVLILKTVSVTAALICCALVYRIGLVVYKKPRAAKLLCALFCVYFLSMDSLYHGQPRTFGALLFCLFMYFLFTKRFYALPFFIVSSWFFYPPILPVVFVSCVLTFFAYGRNWTPGFKRVYALLSALSALLPAAFALKTYAGMDVGGYQLYKFSGFLGRAAALPDPLRFISYFVLNLNEHSQLYRYFTIAFLALTAIFILARRSGAVKNIPKEIKLVLSGSAAAFLFTVGFSLPTAARQFVFSLPFALLFVIMDNILLWTDGQLKAGSGVLLAAFLFLHPVYNDIYSFSKYRPVYEYLSRQPPPALIAGHPDSELIHSLPFFSERPVFSFKDMLDFPFSGSAILELRRRYKSNLSFFYAASAADADKFIVENKPDFAVIESAFYPAAAARPGTEKGGAPTGPEKYFWRNYSRTRCDFRLKLDGNEICVIKIPLSGSKS